MPSIQSLGYIVPLDGIFPMFHITKNRTEIITFVFYVIILFVQEKQRSFW